MTIYILFLSLSPGADLRGGVCLNELTSGHGGFTLALCCNSDHISNPFSPLFYPQRLDLLAPFHTMWPRIDIQNILKPQCLTSTV